MSELLISGKYSKQAKTLEGVLEAKEMYIHEGTFHFDDVMCAAMIIKLQEKYNGVSFGKGEENQIKINRGRYSIPDKFEGVICDCLGGYFDHHGALVNHRNNPNVSNKENEMASMGCLNTVIGDALWGEDRFETIDNIIKKWDQADLGHASDFLSLALGRKNPLSDEGMPKSFDEALNMCLDICDALMNEKENSRNYDDIVDSYIKYREKNPLKVINLNEDSMELEESIDSDAFRGDNRWAKLKSYSRYGGYFLGELEKEDSSLREVLDRMDEPKAKDFIYGLLDSERYYTITQDRVENALGNVREVAKLEGIDVLEFSQFPGDVKVFDGAPFDFIVTPQLNSNELAVYAIGDKFEGERPGAPTPRFGFPTNFAGNINLLHDGIDLLKQFEEKIKSEGVNSEDYLVISSLTDTELKDIKELNEKEILQLITDKIKNNEESIEFMEKYNISFIHKDGFLAQIKDVESAEKLVSDLYMDEEKLRYWGMAKGKAYLKKMVVSKNLEEAEGKNLEIYFSKDSSIYHNEAVLKFLQDHIKDEDLEEGEEHIKGISLKKLQVLDKAKYSSDFISMEVVNLLEMDSFPFSIVEEIVNEKSFSRESLRAIIDDFSNENSLYYKDASHIKDSLRLLEFKDNGFPDYDDKSKYKFIEDLEAKRDAINLDSSSRILKVVNNYINDLQSSKDFHIEKTDPGFVKKEDVKVSKKDVSHIKSANPNNFELEF